MRDATVSGRYLEELAEVHHRRQMVFSCCGPGNHGNCQDKFQPVLTEKGICYAFNPTSINESLKESQYSDIFQSIFAPDFGPFENVKIDSTSKSYVMHITLDSHSSKNIDKSIKGVFTLSVNQKNDYMSVIDTGTSIEPGTQTLIRITPSEITSTKRFDSMPIEDRECLFKSEHPGANSSIYQ